MAVPEGFCQAEVTINPNFLFVYPLAMGTTIQYQIGITPITGLVDIAGANNAADIQAAINADPTYQASGTTIVISFVGDLIVALIEKASAVQIAELAAGAVIYPPEPFVDFNGVGLFTCNLVPVGPSRRRKKKKSGYLPSSCPRFIYSRILTNSPISSTIKDGDCGDYINPQFVRSDNGFMIYRYTKRG